MSHRDAKLCRRTENATPQHLGWGPSTARFERSMSKSSTTHVLDLRDAEATLPFPEFRFIDLFAGIGGFRIGMTLAGGKCVWTSEWDRFARETYEAWYGSENIHGDINDAGLDLAEDVPDHEVLCGGFPCQPFSLAGVSKKNSLGRKHGFDDAKQGNLFFRICDVIDAKRPKVLLLENVKNLRSHDGGNTYRVIMDELESRDYVVFDQIIDARHWVPQHRERIFLVCFDRSFFGDEPDFEFPEPPDEPPPTMSDVLLSNVDAKYTLSDKLWKYLQDYAAGHRAKGNGFGYGMVGPDDVSRTISARYHKDGSEILVSQGSKNPRRLSPTEALRLMGYTPELAQLLGIGHDFPQVVSDTQAYRQAGNSVVAPVVVAIAAEIRRTMQANAALLTHAAR